MQAMLSNIRTGIVVKSLLILLLFLPLRVFSEEEKKENSLHADKTDAVLLLDASASMRITDPQRLRNEGAKLFEQFLKPGDRIAIIEFAEDARVLRPFTPFDSSIAKDIEKDIENVSDAGTYTDILAGVKKAKELLESDFRADASQSVILFSDGKFDPKPGQGTIEDLTRQLLDQVVPEIRGSSIKFYTLAFSEQADRDLLKEIAVGTGGVSWYAQSPEEIQKAYADLFLAVKRPQIVPLTRGSFQIDEEVREATFYIDRDERNPDQPITLTSPTGIVISKNTPGDNARWFGGQGFDMVTVSSPKPGSWQVSGISATGGFAQVLTSLKLVTDWPMTVNAGETQLLQVRLYEAAKPVLLHEMFQVVQYAFQITPTDMVAEPVARGALYDDGTHGDKVANDGVFTTTVTIDDPGEYKLRVIAKAPTFERNQQLPFRAKPPLVNLVVRHIPAESAAQLALADLQELGPKNSKEKKATKKDPLIGKDRDIFRAEISEDGKNLKNTRIILLVLDSEKRVIRQTMNQSKEESLTWEATEFDLPSPGAYSLQAIITASSPKGKSVQEVSRSISYTRKAREGEESGPRLVEVEQPKETSAPSPWPPAVLITIVNIAAAFMGLSVLKKAQTSTGEAMPVYAGMDTFSKSIQSLRQRNELAEVDLNDSRIMKDIVSEKHEDEAEKAEESEKAKKAAETPAQVNEGTESKGIESSGEVDSKEGDDGQVKAASLADELAADLEALDAEVQGETTDEEKSE